MIALLVGLNGAAFVILFSVAMAVAQFTSETWRPAMRVHVPALLALTVISAMGIFVDAFGPGNKGPLDIVVPLGLGVVFTVWIGAAARLGFHRDVGAIISALALHVFGVVAFLAAT